MPIAFEIGAAALAAGEAYMAGAAATEIATAAFGATTLGKAASAGSMIAAGDVAQGGWELLKIGANFVPGRPGQVLSMTMGAGDLAMASSSGVQGVEVPGEGAPLSSASRPAPGSTPSPATSIKADATTVGSATPPEKVIQVTKSGVALPADPKYTIPSHYVENPNRSGSYGMRGPDGRFQEKLRIDPPTPPGQKGPNHSHYHLDNTRTHYSPRPGGKDPGFWRFLRRP